MPLYHAKVLAHRRGGQCVAIIRICLDMWGQLKILQVHCEKHTVS